MKKLIAGLIILVIILLAAIYVFIPGQLTVSDFEKVQCSLSGANRILSQPANWTKLWHNTITTSGTLPSKPESEWFFGQDTFRITRVVQNGLLIEISGNEIKAGSTLSLLPLSQDSIAVNWSFTTTSSSDPVSRIQRYNEAVRLKKSMESVLKNIKGFLSRNEMVYGFPVEETSTTDTFLISTKTEFAGEPSVEDIYKMVDKLTAYAEANHAKPTNAPMLNITPAENNHFVVMTALPVDKMLDGNTDINYKRMIAGKFLTTTITGGNETIKNTQREMQLYFQDYSRVAMAIPFMYLVTNRRKEPDSSKWVTKLYFPVM